MYNMLAHPNYYNRSIGYDAVGEMTELAQLIQAGLQEIVEEIEGARANIASQALEHIHSNETVMTLGRTEAVEQFFLAAAKKRQFNVIVAEGGPTCCGHVLAKNLASQNSSIQCILIPDAAIFAMMARVNKVIIGCHAGITLGLILPTTFFVNFALVTANGGLIGRCGVQMLTAAARYHNIPVVVLASMYKLTPVFPENFDSLNLLVNPDEVLPMTSCLAFQNQQNLNDQSENHVSGDVFPELVLNPLYDYVPPQAVSLLITNQGGHPPSYVYRLLGELYHPDDYKLTQ